MSSSSLAHVNAEVRTERLTYKWSIKKFDFLSGTDNDLKCSPWFYSGDKSEKWRLEFLLPFEYTVVSDDDSNMLHDRLGSPKITAPLISLVRDSPGKSHITIYTELKISTSHAILEFSSFTRRYGPKDHSEYSNCRKESKLFTKNSDNDQLTISCIIDIPAEVITSSFDAAISNLERRQLSDDFRLLFGDPIFSDFTIIVGDQKFPSHRYILARRSPVFAAMFEHKDLEENRKKEMKIENIEPDVIKGMLEFIYTDQVTNIKELASGLLEAANKYDLEKLKIMCEKALYEGLNNENAAELLLLADLHRADILKKCVIQYIVDHAPEVIKSSNWNKMGENPELLLEFVNQLVFPQTAGQSPSSRA